MDILKSNSLKNGVLFVPPVTSPVFTEDFDDPIPVGILTLVSGVRERGFYAGVYLPRGFLYSDSDHDIAAKEICETGTRIVGFSTWCHSYPSSLLLAEQIKSLNPEIIVLFGGPQATMLDEATMEANPAVDYILRGEADFSLLALLDLLVHGGPKEQFASVSGLTWRCSSNGHSSIVRNPITEYPKDLNALPFPAYDILPGVRRKYCLDVGRGCPYQCTFCSTNTFFSKDFRVKSPQRIVQEMVRLHDSTGAREFSFTHDSFTARRSSVQAVCESLRALRRTEGREFRWTCSSRIDCADDALLELMADAGCQGIFFGAESGSPRMQKLIKKNLAVDRVPGVVSKCVSLHIEPTVSFITGFPEETREDIEATLRAIIEVLLRNGRPQISLLSLQPGTELFQKHHESIRFDGYFTDFSGGVYGRQIRDRIEKDRGLFSSFFYLPVNATNRRTLILLNLVVNDLVRFPNSFRLLWPRLSNEHRELSLLRILEEFEEAERQPSEEVCDYKHRVLKRMAQYLGHLDKGPNNPIPPAFWDVFLIETAAALMCWRFLQRRADERGKEETSSLRGVYLNGGKFLINEDWTIVQARDDLDTVLQRLDDSSPESAMLWTDSKATCDYLVTARAERAASTYKVRGWKSRLLRSLRSGDAKEISAEQLGQNILIDEYAKFVSELERIGVLRREPFSP